MPEESEAEEAKIIYLKTVAVDGLIIEEEHHIKLSRDGGQTWMRILKSMVQTTIPINNRRY
jgi:photosystem II stability/assembly factor-like uncharacterized protein